jgi:haloalkane dehalogenase
MEILRTPDERFANLAGYPFAPHYVQLGVQLGDLRMHYVDEGPSAASPVLLLHGEPSWSYLYRTMIPVFVAAGHRVVAPDLVGFGRSDKPAARGDYTYQRHVDWVTGFLDALGLRDITLVCQDWGGLIGLRVAAEQPARFARVVAANTALPTGDERMSEAFFAWREFSQTSPTFTISSVVRSGCARPLAPDALAGYDAPFPDERYKSGARQFPMLVPTSPDDPASAPNRAAWAALSRWTKPFLTAFSDGDPITRHVDRAMRERIPGCAGQPHATIAGAGHFLQEDKGDELAAVVVAWMAGLR